ncbi:ribonuclease P protein component [Calidithermus timidus]|uniref:ribonuclease P protein component n=1 Tax=Calidithermus timidus TaxID=307124 RepID=UPI00036BB3D9|nr:ribonuclease P protein component [Calidithermus timidus]
MNKAVRKEEGRDPSGSRLESLKGEWAFARLKKGRAARGRLVSVRWLPNRTGPVKVGLVVSKKVGKAVLRNKIRRRMREILRHMLLPPCDLMVVAQPEAATAGYAELYRDLAFTLKKSGLIQ